MARPDHGDRASCPGPSSPVHHPSGGSTVVLHPPGGADQATGDGGSSSTAAQGWGPDIDHLVYVRKVAMAHDFVALAADRAAYGAVLGVRLAR